MYPAQGGSDALNRAPPLARPQLGGVGIVFKASVLMENAFGFSYSYDL